MKKKLWELARFALSSLSGFGVDYLMYVLLLHFLGAERLILVNIGARLVSGTVNFTLNRLFVFEGDEGLWKSAFKYTVLAIAVLAANTLVLTFLAGVLGINTYLAKLLTEMALFFINWLIQRMIVFRSFCKKAGGEKLINMEDA